MVRKAERLGGRIRPANTGKYNLCHAQEKELLGTGVIICLRDTSSEENRFVLKCDLEPKESVRRAK